MLVTDNLVRGWVGRGFLGGGAQKTALFVHLSCCYARMPLRLTSLPIMHTPGCGHPHRAGDAAHPLRLAVGSAAVLCRSLGRRRRRPHWRALGPLRLAGGGWIWRPGGRDPGVRARGPAPGGAAASAGALGAGGQPCACCCCCHGDHWLQWMCVGQGVFGGMAAAFHPPDPVHAAAAVAPPNTAAIAALTSPAHSLPLAAASPAVVLPQLRESLSDLLTPAEARRPMRSPRIAGPSRIRTAYLQVGPCRKGWTPLFFPHAYRHMRWLAAQVLVPALGHAPSLATLQPARPAAALPLAFCPAAASPFAVCPALSPASHPLHPSP